MACKPETRRESGARTEPKPMSAMSSLSCPGRKYSRFHEGGNGGASLTYIRRQRPVASIVPAGPPDAVLHCGCGRARSHARLFLVRRHLVEMRGAPVGLERLAQGRKHAVLVDLPIEADRPHPVEEFRPASG